MTGERWGELHALVDALLEGELTETQVERLNGWLAVDDDAQQCYLQRLDMHANLLWEHDHEAVWLGAASNSHPLVADTSALDGLSAQSRRTFLVSPARLEPASCPWAVNRPNEQRARLCRSTLARRNSQSRRPIAYCFWRSL
jgi:hypothetical protein